ncbi:D-inositol-3-phosphate glycosyltransferase [Demequina sediminis]|uniref:D-inositol 3-phosphate glycosyltransferase n=1 Tax=Demequina sediminis TaxID=1930058 RepID=A0ABP9WFM0_9MICO|nr:glycosyltransferase [Demequina sediminis]
MASRRLLILTSTMPAREGDGTPAFVADLSAQLAQDFEVRILAPAVPGAPARTRLDDRVEVIRYRYFPRRWEDLADGAILENVRAKRSRLMQVPPLLAGLAWAVRSQVREFRPDAIHAHWVIPQGVVATGVARSVPLVITTLGGDLYALENGAATALKRRALRHARAVTVMNEDMRERAIALGADPATTHVMPMGARLATLEATTAREVAPPSRRHPVRVLAVGRLVEKKGFDVLLAALRAAQSRLELVIVGDGPERATLEAAAAGLPVKFLGQLGRAELNAQYDQAAIAVFPSRRASTGDQDGLPVAMLEAMGAGCAVIASDLPGLNEAIEEGHSGALVPPGDVAALARTIEVVAEDAELRASLGAAARERAQTYSIDAVGAGYRALFHGIVS